MRVKIGDQNQICPAVEVVGYDYNIPSPPLPRRGGGGYNASSQLALGIKAVPLAT